MNHNPLFFYLLNANPHEQIVRVGNDTALVAKFHATSCSILRCLQDFFCSKQEVSLGTGRAAANARMNSNVRNVEGKYEGSDKT